MTEMTVAKKRAGVQGVQPPAGGLGLSPSFSTFLGGWVGTINPSSGAVGEGLPPGECHPNGRKIRSDALPEQLDYRDGGCELSPTCLRCPLERCRYDEPGGARRLLIDSRDETLVRRRDDGAAIDALANEFGISRRSVFRVLASRKARGETNTLLDHKLPGP